MIPDIELDESEVAELSANDRKRRRYENQLTAHPNEQDPDHPGYLEDDTVEEKL